LVRDWRRQTSTGFLHRNENIFPPGVKLGERNSRDATRI
jgi:hypothetical protein